MKSIKSPKKNSILQNVVKLAIFAAIAIFINEMRASKSPSLISLLTKPECNIKGNISVESGHKIYHVLGAEDYESTIIDLSKGERWFCSESEAIANGWNKAPR